jgi:hypothetical protein
MKETDLEKLQALRDFAQVELEPNETINIQDSSL